MKKLALFSTVPLLFAILFSSCVKEDSANVNQDKIHAAYELFYNANQDITYARATFKFSNALGTLLRLSSPSEVTFNGDLLTFQSGFGYYEKEYAGYLDAGTFVWTDTEGKSFTNSIQNNTIEYPANLDTIPRNASYEFFWVGDILSANERVLLTVNGVLEGDGQLFGQNNVNSHSIILALNQLQKLGKGTGNLWLDRYFEPPLDEKTSSGGTITARYRPINKTVYLD